MERPELPDLSKSGPPEPMDDTPPSPQVMLDYQCFCEFAQANYSVTPGVGDDEGEDDGPDDRLRA